MSPAGATTESQDTTGHLSAAQSRIVAASLDLFAQHGVGGTSLQMIADAIGVTKAAVYHQFNTKDEIVAAAAEDELARLEAVVDAADAEPSRARARESLITGMVDLAVTRRRTAGILLGDPLIVRLFDDHGRFQRMLDRFSDLLGSTDNPAHGQVSTAMLMAAISGAVMHPLVTRLDDEALRSQLLVLARRLLGSAGSPRAVRHTR